MCKEERPPYLCRNALLSAIHWRAASIREPKVAGLRSLALYWERQARKA